MTKSTKELEISTTSTHLFMIRAILEPFMDYCKVSHENLSEFAKAIIYTNNGHTQNSMSKTGGEYFVSGNVKNWVLNWGKALEERTKTIYGHTYDIRDSRGSKFAWTSFKRYCECRMDSHGQNVIHAYNMPLESIVAQKESEPVPQGTLSIDTLVNEVSTRIGNYLVDRETKGIGFRLPMFLRAVGTEFGVLTRKDGSNEIIVGDLGKGVRVYKEARGKEFYDELKKSVQTTLETPLEVFTPTKKPQKPKAKKTRQTHLSRWQENTLARIRGTR